MQLFFLVQKNQDTVSCFLGAPLFLFNLFPTFVYFVCEGLNLGLVVQTFGKTHNCRFSYLLQNRRHKRMVCKYLCGQIAIASHPYTPLTSPFFKSLTLGHDLKVVFTYFKLPKCSLFRANCCTVNKICMRTTLEMRKQSGKSGWH